MEPQQANSSTVPRWDALFSPDARAGAAGGRTPTPPPPALPALLSAAPPTPTSAAAAQGPLLTLHVLQFYDFHLGAPPSAVDARGHMWVLKGPTTSAADLGAGHPLGAPAVCGWGAHSHRHRCRGCHCGNWLAVARGGECWVLGVVGTGAPGARTVPAARGGPFSRNLKGVSAWPIGRWP